MASFDMDVVQQVIAACQASQSEVVLAFERAFDFSSEFNVGPSGQFRLEQLPVECTGAGLLVIMRVGTDAAILVLPDSTGLLPAWCIQPDVTGQAKLSTLAVELGMLLLPEAFLATDGTASYVPDLAAALRATGIRENAGRVAMELRCGEKSETISLIWPVSRADLALAKSAPSPLEAQTSPLPSTPQELATSDSPKRPLERPAKSGIQYTDLEDGLAQLPPYSRSLLKIRVPVTVTLAESKQPIQKVLEIGPGSIIHFNKPCEDALTVEVAGQKVALGEAVKVGDKFGLWITSMILPDERFWVVGDRRQGERAK